MNSRARSACGCITSSGQTTAGHHNHPFKWSFSIVLRGSYIEEVLHIGLRGLLANPPHPLLQLDPEREVSPDHGAARQRLDALRNGPSRQQLGLLGAGPGGHVHWRQYNQENSMKVEA